MKRQALQRGFSVIELMVTIAIAGLLMTLAVPYFGKATKQATERQVKQQMVQDFTWARGAAGAADQKSLDSSLASGTPVVTWRVNADCTWTTQISGNTNAAHSTTSTPTTMVCAPAASAGLAVGTWYTLTPTGFVTTSTGAPVSGTLVMTGTTQTYQLQILYSGSVLETHAAAGVDS